MRFILKVDKEDCFKVAELKEITAVELLIINKALHLLSQNEEVAESDRYVAEKLGAELMRMDAVQRPLTAIDGADIADTPQTDCETCKYGQDKHRYAHICNECGVGINNYTPQTETQMKTQNSNLTFEKSDCPWK